MINLSEKEGNENLVLEIIVFDKYSEKSSPMKICSKTKKNSPGSFFPIELFKIFKKNFP